jgi:hypothetical protein
MIRCLTASLALGLALAPVAHAQSTTRIYRCGPQGRIFSQMPCVDAKPVEVHDRRTDAQHADAKQLAQSQARYALMLEKTRLAQTAARAPTPAVHLGRSTAPAVDEKSTPKRRTTEPSRSLYFKAVTPKTAAPKPPQ